MSTSHGVSKDKYMSDCVPAWHISMSDDVSRYMYAIWSTKKVCIYINYHVGNLDDIYLCQMVYVHIYMTCGLSTDQVVSRSRGVSILRVGGDVPASCSMYDGWFVLLLRHRLQICSNGGTISNSDPARCENVLHGYGTSPLEGGFHWFVTGHTQATY